jgi:hypothetical protein
MLQNSSDHCRKDNNILHKMHKKFGNLSGLEAISTSFFFKMNQNFIEQAQPQLHTKNQTSPRPQNRSHKGANSRPQTEKHLLQQTTTQQRPPRLQQ